MANLSRDKVVARGAGEPPDGFADSFYLRELELQCQFGMAAFEEISNRVKEGSQDLSIFAFCHMLLVFSGNVAKLLFPAPNAPNQRTARGKRLREALQVTEDSPIRSRDARNYVEHFDERMERYLESNRAAGLIAHRLILNEEPDRIQLDDGRVFEAKYLQLFNTTTLQLVCFDERIPIQPIYEELRRIQLGAARVLAELPDVRSTEAA